MRYTGGGGIETRYGSPRNTCHTEHHFLEDMAPQDNHASNHAETKERPSGFEVSARRRIPYKDHDTKPNDPREEP